MDKKIYPLFQGVIKKKLQRRIIFYLGINTLLLIGLALTKTSISGSFFEFFPLFFLIFSMFSLLPTFFGRRGMPAILNKSELDDCAYKTMTPSLDSWIRSAHLPSRIGIFLFFFMIVLPVLSSLAIKNNRPYYLAFMIYGAALWRHFKIYWGLDQHFVVIDDHGIAFPVFGFFKNYRREVAFKEIKESLIYGSYENIEMTLDEDLDRGLENLMESGSTFMQGFCCWDINKKSYVFSSSFIPFDDLYEICGRLPGDQMQLIEEFN